MRTITAAAAILVAVALASSSSLVSASIDAHHRHRRDPNMRNTDADGNPLNSCNLGGEYVISYHQFNTTAGLQDATLSVTHVNSGASVFSANSVVGIAEPRHAAWEVEAFSGNQPITQLYDEPVPEFAPELVREVTMVCGGSASSNNFATAIITVMFDIYYDVDLIFQFQPNWPTGPLVDFKAVIGAPKTNATALRLKRTDLPTDSPLYGMGKQYNMLDLRGFKLPVFTREQGVGRGVQPVTEILNLAHFLGGSYATTYGARPIVIAQSSGQLLALSNSQFSEFDFTGDSGAAVSVIINSTMAQGYLWAPGATTSSDPKFNTLPLVSALAKAVSTLVTYFTGLPQPLAPFAYSGAIIGMQGGTEAVKTNLTALKDLDCPMAAFWLQDWTGVRELDLRQGLWWNWKWSDTHYPDYEGMMALLRNTTNAATDADGIRTLTYINCMVVDCGNDCSGGVNLYQHALANGYLVRSGPSNDVFHAYNGGAMIDFTNPAAKSWYVNEVVAAAYRTGIRGFMADFGEALPLDANLNDTSVSASSYHNEYPDAWFSAARDGTTAAGIAANQSFFFGRSAWLHAGSLYSSAWQGDQLCTWDAYDGLGSAVASLLAGGLTGTPFTHSDIGGYNALTFLGIARTEELFLRWCELSAFTTTFRTHDGSDPQANWQFYRSNDTRKAFVRMAKTYHALLPIRETLVAEGAATGLPVARPLMLAFPDANVTEIGNTTQQFALGNVLVTPVTQPSTSEWTVYLPMTAVAMSPKAAATICWEHLWSDRTVEAPYVPGGPGVVTSTLAPIGCPPVWFPCGDSAAAAVKKTLAALPGMMSQCS